MAQFSNDTLSRMDWKIKYRLPTSSDGVKGDLMSKDKSGRPFTIYKNKYLNQRWAYANKFTNEFKTEFDIGHMYGKTPEMEDSVEIARFDKVRRVWAMEW